MTLADEGPNGLGIRRVSPVRQVLTIFGDYWWHVGEPMPTGALVAALADLGVKEAAAGCIIGEIDAEPKDDREASPSVESRNETGSRDGLSAAVLG